MSTPTVVRRPGKPSKLPQGVTWQPYYRDTADGEITLHDQPLPVRTADHMPVGRVWFCPAEEGCDVAEWVFDDLDETARPSQRGCATHVLALQPPQVLQIEGRSGPRNAIAAKVHEARTAAGDAVAARARVIRAAAAADARVAARTGREYVPSAVIGGAWLAAGAATLGSTEATEAYLAGLTLASAGTLIFYVLAIGVQKLLARSGRAQYANRRRRRERARWIMLGPLLTGLWICAAQFAGATPDNARGTVLGLGGLLLVALANGGAWDQMRQRRRAEAERIRMVAEAEVARQQAEARAAEFRALLAEIAEAHEAAFAEWEAEAWEAHAQWLEKRIELDDSAEAAGRKFAAEWERLREDETAPSWLKNTWVQPELTREIQIPDPEDHNQMKRLGHEFWVKAKPGVLSGARPGDDSPAAYIHDWLASMLNMNPAELTVVAKPEDDEGRQIPNSFIVSLSRGVPYSAPVDYPGVSGVHVGKDGGLYGHVGRDLLGKPVYKLYWKPGQPAGGARSGYTGSGKTIVAQVDLLNMLYLGIWCMVHDAKNLIDYADFRGIIPLGCTQEHRDIFAGAKFEIMQRRQKWLASIRRPNRHGIMVAAKAEWILQYGPPIGALWDEFHLHAQDKAFIGLMSAMSRLQRISGLFDWVITQGGGLADFGDSNFRDQVTAASIELMRMSQLQANLTNYPRDAYSPANLPRVAGMMVSQSAGQLAIPYRADFVHREDRDGAIVDHLWIPDAHAPGGARQRLFNPQLPEEDMEILEKWGVLDIWDLGLTEEGWAQLLSDGEGTVGSQITGREAGLPPENSPGVDGVKPKLDARDVVAALLLAHPNGMTIRQMGDHDWWDYVTGPWNESLSGRPGPDRFSRILRPPSAEERLKGAPVYFEGDGGRPQVFRLAEAGREMAEQAQLLLARAGAPGLTTPEQREAWDQQAKAADSSGIVAAEQEALADAEHAAILAAEARAAMMDLS